MIESGGQLLNYIGGQWLPASGIDSLPVENPATGESLVGVPLSPRADVDQAVRKAKEAFDGWRRTIPTERIQYLFKLKQLLDENFDQIARATTRECGKTLAEAQGELRRGIENIEVATGIPSLMMGSNLEDIAGGIDEFMIRQPVGIVAAITPFNFLHDPFVVLPYAIACGNTFILKPSEKVPISMNLVFHLIHRLGLPAGVVNLVNGGREAVDALIDHPDVRAISFVGSSPVAKYVYSRAASNGKKGPMSGRRQEPDCSASGRGHGPNDTGGYGIGFRMRWTALLAGSLAITVGDARQVFRMRMSAAAAALTVGYGLDPGVDMGPVISRESRNRIEGLIQQGASQGAELIIDGRNTRIGGYEEAISCGPTILDQVDPNSEMARTEVFGPVLSLTHVATIDEAIRVVNQSSFGNMASLFTTSGAAARKFRYEVQAGNIGINVGVAAPMAFFPFSGWKESFFGDLHGQGRDAIDFYTEKKVVVERWPKV